MARPALKLQSAPDHGFAGEVVEQIIALIEQRCALTIRRLTDSAVDSEGASEPSA
jgi:serine/threonine-protein kinase HipA